MSVYSTPAIDLAYLMFMIADRECRQNHRDQLLKSYHDQFVATLNQLGCKAKPPTLLDIQVETLKNGLMGKFRRREQWIVRNKKVLMGAGFVFRVLLGHQFSFDVLHGFYADGWSWFLGQNSNACIYSHHVREWGTEEPTNASSARTDVQGNPRCLKWKKNARLVFLRDFIFDFLFGLIFLISIILYSLIVFLLANQHYKSLLSIIRYTPMQVIHLYSRLWVK